MKKINYRKCCTLIVLNLLSWYLDAKLFFAGQAYNEKKLQKRSKKSFEFKWKFRNLRALNVKPKASRLVGLTLSKKLRIFNIRNKGDKIIGLSL